MDEGLGFSFGFGRMGSAPDLANVEAPAGFREITEFVAGAIVGHHPVMVTPRPLSYATAALRKEMAPGDFSSGLNSPKLMQELLLMATWTKSKPARAPLGSACGAVLETVHAFSLEVADSFAHDSRAEALCLARRPPASARSAPPERPTLDQNASIVDSRGCSFGPLGKIPSC